MLNLKRSKELFEQASDCIPGGVNSPVRAFKSVGGTPPFIVKGQGAYLWDADGNRYIDFVGSWGPLILGHAPPAVVAALQKVIENGTSFGAPTELEIELAEMIVDRVPSAEVVRLVNSGTEATMSAVRLARGITGREKIIKFDGCYHGHADSFLIAAGSGAMTLGQPDSPGVTKGTAADTLLADFNDIESVRNVFRQHSGKIAAVIVEPVNGNTGCIPPQDNFLEDLRSACTEEGALLIFDEVMTGFRVARGGANALYGVDADLLTFGKVIGGGMPIGAYGGKREFMNRVAPQGPVYQAGTLSGNPVAVTAGIQTLKQLGPEAYDSLEELGAYFQAGVQDLIHKKGWPLTQHRVGSMFSLFFTEGPVRNTRDVGVCDLKRFNQYFHAMLESGVYLAPSQFEAGFLSLSHSKTVLKEVIEKIDRVLSGLF
jgi:glutamate-1-semialdehyde 2,1-aminomutase